jgi:hypothetical protein
MKCQNVPVTIIKRGTGILILLLILVATCIAAGCITHEKATEPVPVQTLSPDPDLQGAFIGTWTRADNTGVTLLVYPDKTFELQDIQSKDPRQTKGSWFAENETTYSLSAFLASFGGVGLAQYTATCILDPANGTLMYCPYTSPDDCTRGSVMIRV